MATLIKKVLIVGFGSIGKRHTNIIRKYHSNIQITILTRSLLDKERFKDKNLYFTTSLQEAINLKPDAAIIANPSTKHLKISRSLCEKGIHLFIEKPIAAEIYGVQKLIDYCKLNKIILITGYNFRFLPSLLKFKQLIENQKIGNTLSIRAEVGQYLPTWRPNSDYRKNVSAQKKLGGGVILELSHEIDYLSWIFGPITWVKSHASKQSNLEIDVEDTVNIIFGCKKSDKYELTGSLCMDFIRHDTSRFCLAIGEKGSLLWDGISGEIKHFSQNINNWNVIFQDKPERDFTYLEEINHFFKAIENLEEPINPGSNGLDTLFIIDAIKRSSKIDTIVYI